MTIAKLRNLAGCVALSSSLVGCATNGTDPFGEPLVNKLTKHSAHHTQVSYREPEPVILPDEPVDPDGLNLAYARWMEQVGNLGEARSRYLSVASQQPDNAQSLLGLARIDQLAGRTREAEEGFRKALRAEPSAETHFALGRFLASEERLTEAIDHLQQASLAAPSTTAYQWELAVALAQDGQTQPALEQFRKCGRPAEAHYNLGVILKDRGDTTAALAQFRLAAAEEPQLEQAQYWLTELQDAEPRDTELRETELRDTEATQLASHTAASAGHTLATQTETKLPSINSKVLSAAGHTQQVDVPTASFPQQRANRTELEQLQNQQPLEE